MAITEVVASILAGVVSLFVCSGESAKSRQHDSVATVGDADMKLGRCVVGTKMSVKFKGGCGVMSL